MFGAWLGERTSNTNMQLQSVVWIRIKCSVKVRGPLRASLLLLVSTVVNLTNHPEVFRIGFTDLLPQNEIFL